ncbi:MAG: hypothetical protein H7834_00460 [Magnetococcus sp. YQC-9]
MNEKSVGLKSDLPKVDAHELTEEEYAEIPELPPEFFAEGRLYRYGQPIHVLEERRVTPSPSARTASWIPALPVG